MPCAAAPSTSWLRSPTMSTRSGSGCSWSSACASTSNLVWREPSGAAPAMTSKCSSSPKWARMRCAVGSSLEVATASRIPAARRSDSSGRIPSNRLLIAQPLAPISARKAAMAAAVFSPSSIAWNVWSIGGPTIWAARSPSGTGAPTWLSACRKLATIPSAESVRVPSRSKITSSGADGEAERAASRDGFGTSVRSETVPVTRPLSLMGAPWGDCVAREVLGASTRATNVSLMASVDQSASIRVEAARYHGDQAAAPGMLDFAVNVRHGQPPPWLVQRLAARLPDLARYPSVEDVYRAQDAAADRHCRTRAEVVPLAGAAEGFALLGNLCPARAAIIAPTFTEPAAALSAAGVPIHHVVLEPPFSLDGVQVPEDADLVVVGNPTNPTSVLHTREQLLALRRPGRILVVDEAFADYVPGEPESLAGDPLPDVLVLRSLTKTWSLAGLRVGYALGSPAVLARLTARRAHWPVGTLQLTAIAACCGPRAVADATADGLRLAELRAEMVAGLASVGAEVVDGRAPFILFRTPDAVRIRNSLEGKGIAIRRCDTFVGLNERYLRAAVRPEWPLLIDAIAGVLR